MNYFFRAVDMTLDHDAEARVIVPEDCMERPIEDEWFDGGWIGNDKYDRLDYDRWLKAGGPDMVTIIEELEHEWW